MPLEVITDKTYARHRLELMKMSLPNAFSVRGVPYPGVEPPHGRGSARQRRHCAAFRDVDALEQWPDRRWRQHLGRRRAFSVPDAPKPGDRGTVYVAPHLVFDTNGRPLLAGGSPSVGLIPACVTNILNIVEYGLDIETSVTLPASAARRSQPC